MDRGGPDLTASTDSSPDDLLARDRGYQDMACQPESDAQFCSRNQAECDELEAKDNCGKARKVTCGSCNAPLTCGGGGTANVCGFANGNWATQIVDSQGHVGRNVALALDNNDVAHVAYQDTTSTVALKHALLQGGTWTTAALDSGPLAAEYLDIAVTPAGAVHIAARRGGQPTLWTRGAPWSAETIHTFGGRHVALTVDSTGKLHLCHGDSRGELLLYSVEGRSGWSTETIRGKALSGQPLGAYCDLAVDASGGVHVSYENSNWQRLGYAFKPSGGSWKNEDAAKAPQGKVGSYTSITLDSAGKPLISYFRLVDKTIALARRGTSAASWSSEIVDSTGIIAAHTSLALDSAGAPHLSYFDSTLGAVRYAVKQGSAWSKETVAVVGSGTGGFNDLAVDSGGKAHLVFYNAIAKRLEYATQK